jgi:hypothetical protein
MTMALIMNYGTDFAPLGTVGQIHCPTCKETQPEVAVVQYKYAGVFWLFTFVMSRKYLRICSKCKRGIEVDRSSLGALAEKNNIPFMRRFGFLGLATVIFGMGMSGAFDSKPAHSDPVQSEPVQAPVPCAVTYFPPGDGGPGLVARVSNRASVSLNDVAFVCVDPQQRKWSFVIQSLLPGNFADIGWREGCPIYSGHQIAIAASGYRTIVSECR